MSRTADFRPVAATLRRELERHFAGSGRDARDAGLRKTIATNSDLVELRARPLVAMLADAGVVTLEGIRLLDLGCGFGALSAYFGACGADVHGIDLNTSRFRVGRAAAAEHRLPVTLAPGRMEALPALAGAFDVAIMNNTFCYLLEPVDRRRALAGVSELLRPRGVLLIRELNGWHPFDQFTHIPVLPALAPERAARVARLLGRARPVVRVVSPRALARELRDAGYEDVRHLSDRPGGVVRLTRNLARYQHVVARK